MADEWMHTFLLMQALDNKKDTKEIKQIIIEQIIANMKEWKAEYQAEVIRTKTPSDYEQGKIDLFNDLIERFEKMKEQDNSKKN